MYQQIELWNEPLSKLLEQTHFICEMNNHDHAFLCGMIKKFMPRKILEIGVAEGGTTAIIMYCLAMLKLQSDVYSVDLCERLYCDNTKQTGYEYIRLESLVQGKSRHQFYFGKTIAEQIDKIGKDIDFVIIDTTHKLPGEILDFLCVFPYLTSDAIIVLHDTNLNYSRAVKGNRSQIFTSKDSIATKVLFSSVVADKYMVLQQGELPNIAAFSINKDTGKYIESLFYALTFTWAYMPVKEMLGAYRKIFERWYDKGCLKCFDMAIANNRRIMERYQLTQLINDEEIPRIKYSFPYEEVPAGSRIVIYGAGQVGKEIYYVQSELSLYKIVVWVDKRHEEYSKLGMNVCSPYDLVKYDFDYIIIAVKDEKIFNEIYDEIMQNGWNKGKEIKGPIEKY